jgi:hypothetical protein
MGRLFGMIDILFPVINMLLLYRAGISNSILLPITSSLLYPNIFSKKGLTEMISPFPLMTKMPSEA